MIAKNTARMLAWKMHHMYCTYTLQRRHRERVELGYENITSFPYDFGSDRVSCGGRNGTLCRFFTLK